MYEPAGGSNNFPDIPYFASGYPIYDISVDNTGTATINCGTSTAAVDCSPYSGEPVYVAGNSNPALNGVWTITCFSCPTATLEFSAPFTPTSTQSYAGGTVWSPNYWPMVMPFVVQHNATTVEVYECDLDYAFGTFSSGLGSPPDYPTTKWVTAESTVIGAGCAAWGVQYPSTSGYSNSAANMQIAQPSATSVLTGSSSVTNGTQF
jgi:hypothetical protein